jgi:hypothetical protein
VCRSDPSVGLEAALEDPQVQVHRVMQGHGSYVQGRRNATQATTPACPKVVTRCNASASFIGADFWRVTGPPDRPRPPYHGGSCPTSLPRGRRSARRDGQRARRTRSRSAGPPRGSGFPRSQPARASQAWMPPHVAPHVANGKEFCSSRIRSSWWSSTSPRSSSLLEK